MTAGNTIIERVPLVRREVKSQGIFLCLSLQ